MSSADLQIKPGRTYPLRIDCGALYPPEGHPIFDGWLPAQVNSLKRWVKIDFNGVTVLSDSCDSNDASPGMLQIGQDRDGSYGRKFAGTITQVRREGIARPGRFSGGKGDLEAVLELPRRPLDGDQPLLAAGRAGKADFVGIAIKRDGQFAFSYEGWGIGEYRSRYILIPNDHVLSFKVRLGSSLGLKDDSPFGILGRSVIIWKEGIPIWWRPTEYPLGENSPTLIMSNAIGSTAMAPVFRCRVVDAEVAPIPEKWRPGPFTSLVLDIAGRGKSREPLVEAGQLSRSDVIAVQWLTNDEAQLFYLHSGEPFLASRIFDWSDSVVHSLRIELPSFPRFDKEEHPKESRGHLSVTLDGASVWELEAPYFPTRSDTLRVGRNTFGTPTISPALGCVVFNIKQEFHGASY